MVFRIFMKRAGMYKRYLIIFCLTAFTFGCKKETPDPVDHTENVAVDIHTLLNGAAIKKNVALNFNDTVQLNLADLKFYLSDIRFINEKNQEEKADFKAYDENVFLYQLGDSGKFSLVVPAGKYKSARFNVGLAPAINDLNPNQFTADHPLSRDHDMYWDMMKYRFFVLDGKSDYPVAGNFTHVMSYHLGGDEYLRTVELPFEVTLTDNEVSTFNIYFDLEKVFKDIDWTVFFSFHSIQDQKENGLKMMDNVSKSFR